jgi:hypothetical protein
VRRIAQTRKFRSIGTQAPRCVFRPVSESYLFEFTAKLNQGVIQSAD